MLPLRVRKREVARVRAEKTNYGKDGPTAEVRSTSVAALITLLKEEQAERFRG
jgi:hypothetical protein